MISATMREQVRLWAADRCEYCRMPQAQTQLPHKVDHIRSLKHQGATSLENLCWACALCNGFKGSDIATYVPETTELTRLFNPRLDHWHSHFAWKNGVLLPSTVIAAATIELLRMNSDRRVSHRQLLIKCGLFPDPQNRETSQRTSPE
ncbi:MAG: HNH endonuclease [Planctomycetia bacterium]